MLKFLFRAYMNEMQPGPKFVPDHCDLTFAWQGGCLACGCDQINANWFCNTTASILMILRSTVQCLHVSFKQTAVTLLHALRHGPCFTTFEWYLKLISLFYNRQMIIVVNMYGHCESIQCRYMFRCVCNRYWVKPHFVLDLTLLCHVKSLIDRHLGTSPVIKSYPWYLSEITNG